MLGEVPADPTGAKRVPLPSHFQHLEIVVVFVFAVVNAETRTFIFVIVLILIIPVFKERVAATRTEADGVFRCHVEGASAFSALDFLTSHVIPLVLTEPVLVEDP